MNDDLTFLHGQHIPRCIATVDKRFPYHTIQIMTQGAVELFYDDTRYALRGRWFWPCFPGPHIRFHEMPVGSPWEHRYVAFTGARVAHWEAGGIFPRAPLSLTAADVRWLVPAYHEMLAQMNRPGRWGHARAVNRLESILLYVADQCSAHLQPSAPAWLPAIQRELENLNHAPDYAALAAHHRLSLTTLRRRFREATGMSLHQYRLSVLMAEARRRLGNTDAPIKEIAAALGYQDVYYFTRQFTQHIGTSPARYRRSRQS